MNRYLDVWNRTLGRRRKQLRAAGARDEEAALFFEPRPRDDARADKCGATVTHVMLAHDECEAAFRALGMPGRMLHAFDPWEPMLAGVTIRPEGCQVVMNRAAIRSTFDGMLLGVNCYAWCVRRPPIA